MFSVPVPGVNCSVVIRWFWSNACVTDASRISVTFWMLAASGL